MVLKSFIMKRGGGAGRRLKRELIKEVEELGGRSLFIYPRMEGAVTTVDDGRSAPNLATVGTSRR